MTTKAEKFPVVALRRPLPQHEIEAGVRGAIVYQYTPSVVEVEFVDDEGMTIALVTLDTDYLEEVP